MKVATLFLNSCSTGITFTRSSHMVLMIVPTLPHLGPRNRWEVCSPLSGGQASDLFHPLLSNQKFGDLGNGPPEVSPNSLQPPKVQKS